MPQVELKKYGTDLERMTDKERHFVLLYCVNHNASEAAREAGYAHPGSAGSKLLKRKHIQRAIGRAEAIMIENVGIKAEEVLYQLLCCLTRSLDDFTDEAGKLITDVRELTPRAKNSVDSVKQKVTEREHADGSITRYIENELKLVPKANALQMAMQHKGLFAPEKVEQLLNIDWDRLYDDNSNGTSKDPIEEKIASVKVKKVSNNGNGNGHLHTE